MNATMLHPDPHAVKTARFVSARAEDSAAVEYWREFDAGRAAYRSGKGLRHCVTDAMTQGWLTAEAAGADAYWLAMMREAN